MYELFYTILVVGAKNAGKSTFVNMLLSDGYCQTAQAVETCQINSFTERKENFSNATIIHDEISRSNLNHMNVRDKNPHLIVRDYFIPPTKGMIKSKYRKEDRIGIRVYDTPGTTGSYGESVKQWIASNIYRFDLVIYVTDINENFNTDGDFEWILKIIIDFHKTYHQNKSPESRHVDAGVRPEVMFIVNKCDNMTLTKNDDFVFGDENDSKTRSGTWGSEWENKSMTRILFEGICNRVAKINQETGFIQKITPKPMSALEASIFKPFRYDSDSVKGKPDLVRACAEKMYGQHSVRSMSVIDLYKKISNDDENCKTYLENSGYAAFMNALNLPFQRDLGTTDNNILDLFKDQIEYSLFTVFQMDVMNIEYISKLMDIYEQQSKINKIFTTANVQIVEIAFYQKFTIFAKNLLQNEITNEGYLRFKADFQNIKNLMKDDFISTFAQLFETVINKINDKINQNKLKTLMADMEDLPHVEWLHKLLSIDYASESIKEVIQKRFSNKQNYFMIDSKEFRSLMRLYGKRDDWLDNIFLPNYVRFMLKEIKDIGKLTVLKLQYMHHDPSHQQMMLFNLLDHYLRIEIDSNIDNICSANYNADVQYERSIIDFMLKRQLEF